MCFCHISDDMNLQPQEVIAETCAFELLDKPHVTRRIPEVIRDTHVCTVLRLFF